jgi:hypothetical protein
MSRHAVTVVFKDLHKGLKVSRALSALGFDAIKYDAKCVLWTAEDAVRVTIDHPSLPEVADGEEPHEIQPGDFPRALAGRLPPVIPTAPPPATPAEDTTPPAPVDGETADAEIPEVADGESAAPPETEAPSGAASRRRGRR